MYSLYWHIYEQCRPCFETLEIFTLFELSKKCEKVCFVCMLFLDSALRTRLTSKRNEAWILEWTGFAVHEPIQNKTAVFNISKRSPFCNFAKIKIKASISSHFINNLNKISGQSTKMDYDKIKSFPSRHP